MATSLKICQDAAILIGIERPASLDDEGGYGAVLRLCLEDTGKDLAMLRGGFHQSWPQLVKPYTITTLENTESYPLPDDFVSLIEDTVWETDSWMPQQSPLTPHRWAAFREGWTYSSQAEYRVRVAASVGPKPSFSILPDPGPERQFTFEFVSSHWLKPNEDSFPMSAECQGDEDIPIYPADLVRMGVIWRFKKARHLDFRPDLGEYEMMRDKYFGDSLGYQRVRLGRSGRRWRVGDVFATVGSRRRSVS